jgi:hypothetical protein
MNRNSLHPGLRAETIEVIAVLVPASLEAHAQFYRNRDRLHTPWKRDLPAVIQDRLIDLIDGSLLPGGAQPEPGDEFRTPPLEVLRYYRRIVRWSWVPVLGQAQSVLAVVRQPWDIAFSPSGYGTLLLRLAAAASGRFPPWKGLSLALTALVITPEPLAPGEDEVLSRVLETSLRRYRSVSLGLLRVNLGQEAIAFAFRTAPGDLFPEPLALADDLSKHLRRFVPLFES